MGGVLRVLAQAERGSMRREEKTNCAICLSPLDFGRNQLATNKCGHVYHLLCLTNWVTKQQSCPSCRASTCEHTLIKLYVGDNRPDAETLSLKRRNDQLKRLLKDQGVQLEEKKAEVKAWKKAHAELKKHFKAHRAELVAERLEVKALRKRNEEAQKEIKKLKRELQLMSIGRDSSCAIM